MDHARTIAMGTTLLADGRAEDVVEMVEPLLDRVTAPAASTGQFLLRGLLARVAIAHRERPERVFELLPEPADVDTLCTCVRAEVALWRGWALARQSLASQEAPEAVHLLRDARELFASINDPLGQCWALLGQAMAYFALDEYALMRRVLGDAATLQDRLQDDQAERWLHELSIPALRFAGRYSEAEKHVQGLRSLARAWDSDRVRGSTAAHAAALAYDQGAAPTEIIDQAETAESLLSQNNHPPTYPLLTAVHAHAGALRRQGKLEKAIEIIERAEGVLADDPIAWIHLQTLRARIALQKGASEEARTLLDDLVNQAHQLPHGLQRSHVSLLYGEVLAAVGHFEEASTWIRQAHRNAQETGHRGNQLRSRLSLARVATAQGRLDRAQAHLDAAQEYREYAHVLPHAARRFYIEACVAQANGELQDARPAYDLAQSAAAMMGDRPRARALQQILTTLDENAPSASPPTTSRSLYEGLGGTAQPPTAQPTGDLPADGAVDSREESPEPDIPAQLARASVSLPLVAETALEWVEDRLPRPQWAALYRVSRDGSTSLVHQQGTPSEAANGDASLPDSNASSPASIEWVPLGEHGTGPSFYLGVEPHPDATDQLSVRDRMAAQLPVLDLALQRATAIHSPPTESADRNPTETVQGLVARSPEMKRVVEEIRRMQPSHSPVLITGEAGSGKGVVAEAFHRTSERADGPLERISCAPTQHEEPLESRLFGTAEGSDENAPAALDAADGGTLVIEDVDALPLPLQSSLLQLIEAGTIAPTGNSNARPADVRIVATTTADLDARVQEGRFRRELRNRLRLISLRVPPLRQRRADIPLLAHHFVDTLRPSGPPDPPLVSITQPAMEALLRYQWPGNVRQLRNEIERALVYVQSEPAPTISLDILSDNIVENAQRTEASQTPDDDPDAILEPNQTLSDVLSRTERSVIERVLRACDGQITASADVLGLTRQGLYKKMKRLDIDASSFQSVSEPAPTAS